MISDRLTENFKDAQAQLIGWLFERLTLLKEIVFCFENCSHPQGKNIVLVIKKNLFEFQAEVLLEFAKNLRSQEQFIQTVKGQNNFW